MRIKKRPLIILGLLLALVIGFFVVKNNLHFTDENKFFCNAEKVLESEGEQVFKTENGTFFHGETRSEEYPYLGRYSSKVWAKQDTGLSFRKTDVKAGEIYRISVFRFHEQEKGKLAVSGDWGLNIESDIHVGSHFRDYRQLLLLIRIPENVSAGKMEVFCTHNGPKAAYFDNLLIEKLETEPRLGIFPEGIASRQNIEITLPEEAVQHLREQQAQGLNVSYHLPNSKHVLAAQWKTGPAVFSGNFALAGNWQAAHQRSKWTFCLTSEGQKPLEFHPECDADYAQNVLFHAFLKAENLPARSYSLAEVRLNREKPQSYVLVTPADAETKSLADFVPISDSQNLSLDMQAWGRFFALVELFRAYDALLPENLGMSAGPANTMQPVLVRDFQNELHYPFYRRNIRTFYHKEIIFPKSYIRQYFEPLWRSSEFVTAYMNTLAKYARAEDFRDVLAQFMPWFSALLQMGKESCPPDKPLLHHMQWNVRRLAVARIPFKETSVRAHAELGNGEDYALKIANQHLFPLEILGFGRRRENMSYSLPEPVLLSPHRGESEAEYQLFKGPKKRKFVFVRIPGETKTYALPILQYPAPMRRVHGKLRLKIPEGALQKDKKIILEGRIEIREDMTIPAGYELHVRPGTQLDLRNSASIISKSPVFFEGSSADPIRVTSSDSSASGMHVLQAAEKSILKHTRFEKMNTLLRSDWKLTGGVSFYESAVEIAHSSFGQNFCEDALNLIRSSFTMHNSKIHDTWGDGLDLDFCKGKIENCTFLRTGNDAMDFSGSEIEVRNTSVDQAGDKGISVGEASHVRLYSAKVRNCQLGVASKDLSLLEIDSIHLANVHTAFAAYQKKPEYGPAKIVVRQHTVENIVQHHMLQPGSQLSLNGRKIVGKR